MLGGSFCARLGRSSVLRSVGTPCALSPVEAARRPDCVMVDRSSPALRGAPEVHSYVTEACDEIRVASRGERSRS